MKLGFIGCGNMAKAIINGIVQSKALPTEAILIYDVLESACAHITERYGVQAVQSSSQIAAQCDVVLLAVKPNVIASVLEENRDAFLEHKTLLISIAAGKSLSFLEENLASDACKIVRVMPNINAKVGAAMSGYCCNRNVTEEDEVIVTTIFASIGLIIKLEESQFSAFSAIAGCAPAFVYLFTDALARAGVQNGMKKKEALQIAAQTVFGSAKMMLESDEHPWELIDQVCSPGGTTVEGVISLQADGLEAAVHRAVNRAVQKDQKL